MINAKTFHGLTELSIKGSGYEIMADLAIINTRVMNETKMPEFLIKMTFESTLKALKDIQAEEDDDNE